MSGFKKTLQKLTAEVSKNQADTQPSTTSNEITGFIHAPEVTLLKGIHKGISGFVTSFHAGKYQFKTSETFYTPKSKYVRKPREEIVSEVPILYRLLLPDNTSLDIPVNSIAEIVVYKTGNTLHLGNVLSSSGNENSVRKINLENDNLIMAMSELNMDIGIPDLNKLYISNNVPGNTNNVFAPIKLVENLSKRIIAGNDFVHLFNNETIPVETTDILDRYFIVFQGNSIGKFGTVKTIFEPQYIIQKTQIDNIIGQGQVQKGPDGSVQIVKGKFKSDKIYNPDEYEYSPPHLSITLATNGRKVTESSYNIGTSYDPKFVTRKITPNDVFYHDVNIKNLGIAQVKRINKDGTFDAITKIALEDIANVPFSDVINTEPGFKWKYNGVTTQQEELSAEEQPFILEFENTIEETDEDNEKEADGYGDGDEGQEEEAAVNKDDGLVLETQPEMQETFNDKDRLNQTETKLTSNQQSIKNKISTILKNAIIHEDSINIYTCTELVEQVFKTLEKNNDQKSILNTTDGKYITAALVFCELIISGYRQVNKHFGLSSYIKSLIKAEYFKNGDVFENNNIKYSILLKQSTGILSNDDFQKQNSQVKKLWENNKFQDILEIMMDNALALVQKLLNRVILREPNSININELIPLDKSYNPNAVPVLEREYSYPGKKYNYTVKHYSALNENTSNVITIEELAQNIRIPTTEKSILWGSDTQPLIKETKENLLMLASQETDPSEYQYIIDNLERGPYAIREMDKSKSDLKEYFKMVFKNLLVNAIKIKRRSQKSKLKRQREIEHDRDTLHKRRAIINQKKLEDGDETDEDEETFKNTNSYEKERRIREMKQSIAKGARMGSRKYNNEQAKEAETEAEETVEDKIWRQAKGEETE